RSSSGIGRLRRYIKITQMLAVRMAASVTLLRKVASLSAKDDITVVAKTAGPSPTVSIRRPNATTEPTTKIKDLEWSRSYRPPGTKNERINMVTANPQPTSPNRNGKN